MGSRKSGSDPQISQVVWLGLFLFWPYFGFYFGARSSGAQDLLLAYAQITILETICSANDWTSFGSMQSKCLLPILSLQSFDQPLQFAQSIHRSIIIQTLSLNSGQDQMYSVCQGVEWNIYLLYECPSWSPECLLAAPAGRKALVTLEWAVRDSLASSLKYHKEMDWAVPEKSEA